MPIEPYNSPRGVWKRFLLGSALIAALMTGATAAIAIIEIKHIQHFFPKNTLGAQVLPEITPAQAGAAETILVIGSDKRRHSSVALDRLSPPHSDTLMLIRLDPTKSQTSILSIPRDLQVTIAPNNAPPSIQKINAAYSIGGPGLVARTIKQLLPGIQINHIIDVNFFGFRHVIDAIGCVYVFVDRHYYNPVGTAYAAIDIQPGYQRLCDQTALDYVRYRHTDSDFVRVARQQDFIRQAKQQVSALGLFNNQDALLGSITHAVQTDIHGSESTHLFELALFSLGRPIRQVPFVSTPGPSYVTATSYDIYQTVHAFLGNAPSKVRLPNSPRPRSRHGHASSSPATVPGLSATPSSDIGTVTNAAVGFPLKLYVPQLQIAAAPQPDVVRTYTLYDEQQKPHKAYAISIAEGLVGEYYGVEGTDWTAAPILAGSSQQRKINGRTYFVFLEGAHIHLVAWRSAHAVYWLNNTLLDDLSNAQMLAIAESARPVN